MFPLLQFWEPGSYLSLFPQDRTGLFVYRLFSAVRGFAACLFPVPFLPLVSFTLPVLFLLFLFISPGSYSFSYVPWLSWEKVDIALPFSARLVLHSRPPCKEQSCVLWLLMTVYLLLQCHNPVPGLSRQTARTQRLYSRCWLHTSSRISICV